MISDPIDMIVNKPAFKNFTILFGRLAVGLLFLISGILKVFTSEYHGIMLQTITDAGFPIPEVTTWFVSLSELVFGGLLTLGLWTRSSAFVLAIVAFVALVSVQISTVEGDTAVVWFSNLLFVPDVPIIAVCLLLVAFGGGKFGLDVLANRRS